MVMKGLHVYKQEPGKRLTRQISLWSSSKQDEKADEIFYEHLGVVSHSLALFLLETSTYHLSSGNAIQQRGNSLEDSWNVQKKTS